MNLKRYSYPHEITTRGTKQTKIKYYQTNYTELLRVRSNGRPVSQVHIGLQHTRDEHVRHHLAVRFPILAVVLRATRHIAEVAMYDHGGEEENLRGRRTKAGKGGMKYGGGLAGFPNLRRSTA